METNLLTFYSDYLLVLFGNDYYIIFISHLQETDATI